MNTLDVIRIYKSKEDKSTHLLNGQLELGFSSLFGLQ